MICLTESTIATDVRLSEVDYEYLLGLSSTFVEDEEVEAPKVFRRIAPTLQHGIYRVQVGPYVGRIGLPSGDSIDLRSRFAFDDFVALLRRAGRLPTRVDALSASEEAASFIVDALVYAFVREVQALAGRGLAKGYVDSRRDGPRFAGRPDIARHIATAAGRPERIASVSRTITTDVPVNQALRRGYEELRRCELRPELAGRLARLGPALASVRRTRMSADDVALLALDPCHLRYREALGLAEVAIRGGALTPSAGPHAGASMLFYMPTVWHACVAQWVRDHHPQKQIETEYPFRVIDSVKRDGRADVVVLEHGKVVGLFDAKYKSFGNGPKPPDVYQMVAYCEALGLPEANLVYPGEPAPPLEIRCGRYTIRCVGLQVSAEGAST